MLPPSGQSSNNTPAIVAAVFVILIVTVLVAVTAVVVILIVLRRKRKTKEAVITAVHYTRDESGELKDLGNPLYSGMTTLHIAQIMHLKFTQWRIYTLANPGIKNEFINQ